MAEWDRRIAGAGDPARQSSDDSAVTT
jgi:hypothetical protein